MSEDRFYLDFETYSEEDIKRGVQYYSRAPSTELLCFAYKLPQQETRLWIPGDPDPDDLFHAIQQGLLFTAWNAAFEKAIWTHVCHARLGWPQVPLEQYRCSMALAASYGLPLSLDKAGAALRLDVQKDKDGKRLLSLFSKPRKRPRKQEWYRIYPEDKPQDYKLLCNYCITDVDAEIAVHEELPRPDLSPNEQQVWFLDQRINERGICVDVQGAENMVALNEEKKKKQCQRLVELTDGYISSGNQSVKIKEWCNDRGAGLENLQKPTIAECLEKEDTTDEVREMLDLRLKLSSKTIAKYHVMINKHLKNGRVCDNFQYYSAHTGRFGGRGLQLQNLSRPVIKKPEEAMEFVKSGESLVNVEGMYGDFTKVVISCIRSTMVSDVCSDLFVADYSAIEARVLAFIAGQDDVTEVFRTHGKIYEQAASGIYKVPLEAVTSDQRFIGKIAILALGYQGGVNAFQGMARNYGVDLEDEDFIRNIVNKWRKANSKIVKYWYAVEKAAKSAIKYPERVFKVTPTCGVRYVFKEGYLYCILPSRRFIAYPQAEIRSVETKWGTKKQICFKTLHDGRWITEHTYGGRLTENIVQGYARDLLVYGMLECESAGYQIVIHVHDEIGAEVSWIEQDEGKSLEEFERLMCSLPPWARGLPLEAEGYIAQRYRK